MDRITHEMRLQQWTRLLQECNESGLTKLEWCRQNNISNKLFFYWQRRVREEAYSAITVHNTDPSVTAHTFVQLPVTKQAAPYVHDIPTVTIKAHGYSIEISESVSEALLNRLIGALSHAE